MKKAKKKSPLKVKRLYVFAGPDQEDQFSMDWNLVKKKDKNTFNYLIRYAKGMNYENLFKFFAITLEVKDKPSWDDAYSCRTESKFIKKILIKKELSRKKVEELFN